VVQLEPWLTLQVWVTHCGLGRQVLNLAAKLIMLTRACSGRQSRKRSPFPAHCPWQL
jgi:hypothetical protein